MKALEEEYDVIVVGAGINGIGIARDVALRGLSVLLVEREDICAGVSAWSGRLIHGGLRYLEHLDFGLVRESLVERERLLKQAPHLVKPVPLIMPVYSHNKRPLWMVELGMVLYDLLSLRKTPPTHRLLSKLATIKRFPGIAREGLKSSVLFYDAQVELAERLCVELVLDAVANGAQIRTHARVDRPILVEGVLVGISFIDALTGIRSDVGASIVINAAGPWIDNIFSDPIHPQPRLNGGTKGSHLVVDRFPGSPNEVVYYESKSDGRLILVIPWLGKYMIGTTDIRFDSDPALARCDIGEVDYLLAGVNALIPEAKLSLKDVLYTYSGVRPLPYEPEKAESSVTRSHILFDHQDTGMPGLVSVVGGKLTTFRQLAEDAGKMIVKKLGRGEKRCQTRNRNLPGAVNYSAEDLKIKLKSTGLSDLITNRLHSLYGVRALQIAEVISADSLSSEVVMADIGLTVGEIRFTFAHEFVQTLTDLLARRLLVAFNPGHGLNCIERIAAVVALESGWNEADIEREIADYREWLDHLAIPDATGPRSNSFGS